MGALDFLKEAEAGSTRCGIERRKKHPKQGLVTSGLLFVSQVTADRQAHKDLANQLTRRYAEECDAPGESVNT